MSITNESITNESIMNESIMNESITITHESGTYTVPMHTTPLDFFKQNNLPHPLLVYANSTLSDLTQTLSCDTSLVNVDFASQTGKSTFWHSSAHILGCAIKRIFPHASLASGPPTANGFYYDVDIGRPLTPSDLVDIEAEAAKVIKENLRFVRSEMTSDALFEMYEGNPFKKFYVKKAADGVVYTIGEFVDFCRGPHINRTGLVKVLKLVKHGSSHFKATTHLEDVAEENNLNSKMEDLNIMEIALNGTPLQRIYGVSFPSKALYKEYQTRMEMAKTRDHRRVGSEHQLFFFSDLSPGSGFFTPDGTFIYNSLIAFIQEEYKRRGFKEVITPNIYSTKLWEQSGHLSNYKENMFILGVDEEEFALKPMNCPGHCLIFKHTTRSYRDLPLRFADFGALHRNELSGALTGLTRVRRFQQDDAHIFCALDQVEEEITACIAFLENVYKTFNFKYELALSTRPDKFIGDIETWNEAEEKLRKALQGHKYTINPKDGAFYGPKIDITLEDVYGRKTQCATIQLDFQLPERFDLTYWDSDGNAKRPVIIHRAILGSVERFIAILLENFGTKLPFWLSPWQIAVINTKGNHEYAQLITKRLWKFNVCHFKDSLTLQKQIRMAEMKGFRLIVVVGDLEKENKSVNVRGKGDVEFGVFKRNVEKMMEKRIEYDEAVEANASGESLN